MYSPIEDDVKHVCLLKHHVKENNHSESISQMFQYKRNVKGYLPLHKIHILFVHHNLQEHDLCYKLKPVKHICLIFNRAVVI